jgi:hypothetical protein
VYDQKYATNDLKTVKTKSVGHRFIRNNELWIIWNCLFLIYLYLQIVTTILLNVFNFYFIINLLLELFKLKSIIFIFI